MPQAATNTPCLLDSLQEVLLTILYTSSVREAVPVSAILVAESGTAKSKLLQALNGASIHHTDSVSSQGLFELMGRDTDGKISWIILPDMNPTLSRRPATVASLVANLLTLTMDGTCRVDDGRQDKIMKHNPIGILSAVTPDIYSKQSKKWLALGLRRRIIPLFFNYSQNTILQLIKAVGEDKISGGDFPKMNYKNGIKQKPIISEMLALQIQYLSTTFSQYLGSSKAKDTNGKIRWYVKNIIPISPLVTLRTLARAHAIRHKRATIDESDIKFLADFLAFTNPEIPKQL
jgi:hypothetical protein